MPVDLKDLERTARDIGNTIGATLDDVHGDSKVGFCLLLFDFGPGGHATYISNAQRQDMMNALREFLGKMEGN